MTKKVIKEYLQGFHYELDGERVSHIVSHLDDLLTMYGDTLVFEWERDYYGNVSTVIMKERLETDEEYNMRSIAEVVKQDIVKERELKLLAELKAKYEHQEHN
jgi:hypothetical protein